MATTNTLKDKLVLDLQDITTGNGFNNTVDEVLREPKRMDELNNDTVICIRPGEGGTSELETLGNQNGEAFQRYELQLWKHSMTPNADMDDLLDDVRNAVGRSTGNLLTASGVDWAGVEAWTEVVTDPNIHENLYYREATVAVRYLFTRGSL